MSEEIIITAKTLDEAIAKAEAEYSGRGSISYDILEMPKKGFLGFGSTPAKIKVTITPENDILGDIMGKKDKGNNSQSSGSQSRQDGFRPFSSEVESKPKQEKPAASPAPAKADNPEAQKPKAAKQSSEPKAPAAKASAPKASAPKAAPAKEAKEVAAKPEKPAAQPQKKEYVRRERPAVVISQEEMDIALDFINRLLKNMDSEATAVQAEPPEGAVFEGVYPKIDIVGDNSGILIGHHGETLDAIQFLANLCMNRKTGASGREFVKINVDIENYRAKREETLRALARRMAQKAIKYKRNVVLEPMNPYERHIIHSELQDMEKVDTHSVGSDENRKVVITYEGADKSEHKRNSGRRNSRRDTQSKPPVRKISEEESAKIQETYAAYQEEKAGRERPRRASSIDEILGKSDDPDEPLGL